MTGYDTFLLDLPDGWLQLPTTAAELRTSIEAVRRARPATTGEQIELARGALLLERIVRRAEEGGLVFAATFTDASYEEEAGVDVMAVLAATCWLATWPAAAFDAERVTFAQLRAAVAQRDAGSRLHEVHPPSEVDLPAGPAVADVLIEHGDESVPDVLHYRFHVLIGTGEGIAQLGFLTPNVELAPELGDLFQSIAETLEFAST